MTRFLLPAGCLIPLVLCLGAVVLAEPPVTRGVAAEIVFLCVCATVLAFLCGLLYHLAEPYPLRIAVLLLLFLGVPAVTLLALDESHTEEAAIQAAPGQVLTGAARIINASMVEIAGETVQLHGIHAPTLGQTCLMADGTAYRCGMVAAQALSGHVGGRHMSCDGQSRARTGALQAVCRVDGADLNRWLVREGYVWARAGSDYIPDEDEARTARRGLWQLPFAAEYGRPEQ